ncbi:MAG: SAM-dependent methyltransferase, partial [Chloroflexi bacterium]|nr:SAM-dependent methyltransferase [Chloroflexota bacterium]
DNDSIVFFQIPNADYVLGDLAFWDVYYEHCSYFSKGSLAHLFHNAGFDVKELWTDYDDQYLMIEARPRHKGSGTPPPNNIDEMLSQSANFEKDVQQLRSEWQAKLAAFKRNGRSFTLWGGGSKGVAFLTTLGLTLDDIQYVVDINPNKTGTFMAGTGQEIVAPDFLKTYKPDVVIIMNPIYRDEISRDLQAMGLSPEILTM